MAPQYSIRKLSFCFPHKFFIIMEYYIYCFMWQSSYYILPILCCILAFLMKSTKCIVFEASDLWLESKNNGSQPLAPAAHCAALWKVHEMKEKQRKDRVSYQRRADFGSAVLPCFLCCPFKLREARRGPGCLRPDCSGRKVLCGLSICQPRLSVVCSFSNTFLCNYLW